MHLVAPLIAGVRGAENGSVKFTRRGTAAPSRIYRSFEGIDPDDSGDAVLLDSNGGVEIYVDTLTTVSVKDSEGNELREFVAGSSAPAIELRSKSFDGQEYDDGSGIKPAGPLQPTTIQRMADLWLEVNGATNWRIGDGSGGSFSLPDLVVALIHGSLDVTSPAFGAQGNLINDDLAAFVLADAEATARGGAVILVPPNLGYRLSGAFTLGPLNSLLALGPDAVLLEIDVGASGTLILNGGNVGRFVEGFRFQSQFTGNSAPVILLSGTLSLRDCVFGEDGSLHGDFIEANDGSRLEVKNCDFHLDGSSASVLTRSDNTQNLSATFEDCRFVTPTTAYTGSIIQSDVVRLTRCDFLPGPSVSNPGNAFNLVDLQNGAVIHATDCFFGVGANGTFDGDGVAIARTTGGSRVSIFESGNRWLDGLLRIEDTAPVNIAEGEFSVLSLRQFELEFAPNVTGVTLHGMQYRYYRFPRNDGNNVSIALAVPLDALQGGGYAIEVEVRNTAGANFNVTFTGQVMTRSGSNTCSAGEARVFRFVASSLGFWMQANEAGVVS